MAALLVSVAVTDVAEASGHQISLCAWVPLVAFFIVVVRQSRKRATIAAAVVIPGLSGSYLDDYSGAPEDAVVTSILLVAGIWIIGEGGRRLTHSHRRLADAIEPIRLDQMEREERAVLAERVRIAREIHDVVTYHMSVVSIQARLAKLRLHSDPAVATQALQAVAETSSQAMEEMRRLVVVLRRDTGSAIRLKYADATPPGVDQLPVLIERSGMAGLTVSFTEEGTPRPVAASTGQCVYRIVQESLSNVIKHADSAACEVQLVYRRTSLTVVVTNEAPTTVREGRVRCSGSGGHGIIGMRERAELLGGALSAGALPGGGFEVRLTLPLLTRSDKVTEVEAVR